MRLMAAEASPNAEETVKVSFLKFSGSDMSFPSVKPVQIDKIPHVNFPYSLIELYN